MITLRTSTYKPHFQHTNQRFKRGYCRNTNLMLYSYSESHHLSITNTDLKVTPMAHAILKKDIPKITELLQRGWRLSQEPERLKYCYQFSWCNGRTYSASKYCQDCEHHRFIDFFNCVKMIQKLHDKNTAHSHLDPIFDVLLEKSTDFEKDIKIELIDRISLPFGRSVEIGYLIPYFVSRNKISSVYEKFQEKFKCTPQEFLIGNYEERNWGGNEEIRIVYFILSDAKKQTATPGCEE